MIRHLQDVNNGGWGIFIGYDKYLHFVKSEKWIAAFFILYREHSNVTVVLGTNDLSRVDESTMRYNVKKCKHGDYKEVSLGNDIMMLKVRICFLLSSYLYKAVGQTKCSMLYLHALCFFTSFQDPQKLYQFNCQLRRQSKTILNVL